MNPVSHLPLPAGSRSVFLTKPDTSPIKVGSALPGQSLTYMSYEDIPILVVDDAKFSSAIIAKALRSGGFSNVRFTNNPLQALRSL
jgi:PleD family two-component response regulator